jgi:hypothetical protein
MQELNPDDVTGLESAGLQGVLPYQAAYSQVGVLGSGLFSRYPVESVRPEAPESQALTPKWKRDLGDQPTTSPDGPIHVLAGVTLDRVLADRRVGVRAARTYRISGSDHRAFFAELVLPPT